MIRIRHMWKKRVLAFFTMEYEQQPLMAKEIEAIYKLAKRINVSDEQVQQIRSFIDEENKLIEKRAKTIFPDGLDVLLQVYDEKFLQNK